MSEHVGRTIVVLDGAQFPATFRAWAGGVVHDAESVLTASDLFTRLSPQILVVAPDLSWHQRLCEAFPARLRPAVVAVSEAPPGVTFIDEWLRLSTDPLEAGARLDLACERASQRRRQSRQAFTDALTGLPNRRSVVHALAHEAARSRRSDTPVALVLFDLDGFKQVNDNAGHAAGDSLLRRVGGVFRSAARATELCGRIGGDEFALVLSGDEQEAERAAHRLADLLPPLRISASSASAVLRPGESLRQLYRRADEGLRAAKERRRRDFVVPGTPVRRRVAA
jgi:diguanylate cyclase (GGDEF)-like protein